jgi:hypothetical protein
MSPESAVGVLSCTVRRRYQATTSEDLVLAVVVCRVFRLVKMLQLFVVTSYKPSVNPIIDPDPVSSH